MKIKWNLLSRKRSIPKKNMNWSQAKRRFPGLNPMGDADRDGVKNRFDCRPFNRMRQDEKTTFFEEGRRKNSLTLSRKEEKYIEDTFGDEIEDIPSHEVRAAIEEYRE